MFNFYLAFNKGHVLQLGCKMVVWGTVTTSLDMSTLLISMQMTPVPELSIEPLSPQHRALSSSCQSAEAGNLVKFLCVASHMKNMIKSGLQNSENMFFYFLKFIWQLFNHLILWFSGSGEPWPLCTLNCSDKENRQIGCGGIHSRSQPWRDRGKRFTSLRTAWAICRGRVLSEEEIIIAIIICNNHTILMQSNMDEH